MNTTETPPLHSALNEPASFHIADGITLTLTKNGGDSDDGTINIATSLIRWIVSQSTQSTALLLLTSPSLLPSSLVRYAIKLTANALDTAAATAAAAAAAAKCQIVQTFESPLHSLHILQQYAQTLAHAELIIPVTIVNDVANVSQHVQPIALISIDKRLILIIPKLTHISHNEALLQAQTENHQTKDIASDLTEKISQTITNSILTQENTDDHNAISMSDTISVLEGMVNERTRELVEKNAQLILAKALSDHAAQVKSDFLSNMSHEIRTPLNAVIGAARLLESTLLSSEQRHYLSMISTSGKLLLSLINDILDLSKIESGRMELEQREFSLHDCIEAAVHLCHESATDKQIDLAYVVHPHIPSLIIGDSVRVQQILINLLSNAVKFTDRSPHRRNHVLVTVQCRDLGPYQSEANTNASTNNGTPTTSSVIQQFPSNATATSWTNPAASPSTTTSTTTTTTVPSLQEFPLPEHTRSSSAPYLVSETTTSLSPDSPSSPNPSASQQTIKRTLQFDVSVEDTGIGMTREVQSRLFEPFSQGDSTVTRRFGGSGLGLAICRRLAERMGGKITLSSQSGLGSTFTFSFVAPGIMPTPTHHLFLTTPTTPADTRQQTPSSSSSSPPPRYPPSASSPSIPSAMPTVFDLSPSICGALKGKNIQIICDSPATPRMMFELCRAFGANPSHIITIRLGYSLPKPTVNEFKSRDDLYAPSKKTADSDPYGDGTATTRYLNRLILIAAPPQQPSSSSSASSSPTSSTALLMPSSKSSPRSVDLIIISIITSSDNERKLLSDVQALCTVLSRLPNEPPLPPTDDGDSNSSLLVGRLSIPRDVNVVELRRPVKLSALTKTMATMLSRTLTHPRLKRYNSDEHSIGSGNTSPGNNNTNNQSPNKRHQTMAPSAQTISPSMHARHHTNSSTLISLPPIILSDDPHSSSRSRVRTIRPITRHSGMRILLAEDNPINIKLMKMMLSKLGYPRIEVCMNGLHVIRILEQTGTIQSGPLSQAAKEFTHEQVTETIPNASPFTLSARSIVNNNVYNDKSHQDNTSMADINSPSTTPNKMTGTSTSPVLTSMTSLVTTTPPTPRVASESAHHQENIGFDCLLMDCQMDRLDGVECTKYIRLYERSLQHYHYIIAQTATVSAEFRQRCVESGMDDHIVKPIDVNALRNALIKASKMIAARKQQVVTTTATTSAIHT